MSTTKVGIIGFGYWGPNLTRNFSELSGSELVAIKTGPIKISERYCQAGIP